MYTQYIYTYLYTLYINTYFYTLYINTYFYTYINTYLYTLYIHTYADGRRMRDFLFFDVIIEHAVRHTMDCPGHRWGAVFGAVDSASAIRHMLISSLSSLRKGFQCILQCNGIFLFSMVLLYKLDIQYYSSFVIRRYSFLNNRNINL